MNNITFIFGAGASRKALPTVDEMPSRIQKLIEFLEREDMQIDNNSSFDKLGINGLKSKRFYQNQLIDSLKWMLDESQRHASVDTFAKKLFIKSRYQDLKKLKIAMSVFFIFEQALNKPDPRYDAFFASLLNSVNDFPLNVKVLSWNYDYQFELAYSEYSEKTDILSNQGMLRVKSKYGRISGLDGFGIYKLNGTIGFSSDGGFRQHLFAPDLKVSVDIKFISQVIQNFVAATYLRNVDSSLSFAWEPEIEGNSIVERAIEQIKNSVALVIIGYSFPFFNY